MKLQIKQPIRGDNLAALLEGDEGAYLCQNRGQNYLVTSERGHSIAFGPTPVGIPVEPSAQGMGFHPEPWTVTKISNDPHFIDKDWRQESSSPERNSK